MSTKNREAHNRVVRGNWKFKPSEQAGAVWLTAEAPASAWQTVKRHATCGKGKTGKKGEKEEMERSLEGGN